MKDSKMFLGAIIFILIVVFFLASCTPKSCPTYSEGDIHPPIDMESAMTVRYDTIISIQGDTTYYRRPYKLTTLEKVGFVATGALVLWVIQWSDHNKDP